MTHKSLFFLLVFFLLACMAPKKVWAHAPNQSYIFMHIYDTSVSGRIEITTKDLNTALGLNLKRGMTLEEINPFLPQIKNYILERLSFRSISGNHSIKFTGFDIRELERIGDFILADFDLENITKVPDELTVNYNFLFDKISTHTGFLVIENNWKAGIHNSEEYISLVFKNDNRDQTFSLLKSTVFNGFMSMIKIGMWHIWIGIDHILFLLALILPSVITRMRKEEVISTGGNSLLTGFLKPDTNNWVPVEKFKSTFIYVVKIITLFTVAHAITLSLATFDIVKLPSFIVESVIALSIGLAAYHNIHPIFKNNEWVFAFGFGLFHGFGFASVLADIGLNGEFMTLSLLGFNLGVEIGHIILIIIFLPILFALRKRAIYSKILGYGSLILIIIAIYWFITRLFDLGTPVEDILGKIYSRIIDSF
ncbi:MAG: hypothetical protein GKR88_20380 [Flavobacteriaceae bacterium]|nr:MAG: hypothetical protein GKR88_20380 [Flavobacteriaceae bacterium]